MCRDAFKCILLLVFATTLGTGDCSWFVQDPRACQSATRSSGDDDRAHQLAWWHLWMISSSSTQFQAACVTDVNECTPARTIKRPAPFALWKDALSRAAFYRADPRFRVLAALVDERRSRLCPRGPERM